MQRRTWLRGVGAAAVGFGVGVLPGRAAAATSVRIATLAGKASPWGRVLTSWAKHVAEDSGGALELQISFGATHGDEAAIVGKMRGGQLDGAAVTGVGLGEVYKPILALQMPGLFSSWAKLDSARQALTSEFQKGARAAGFSIAGWGDVGLARTLSRGVAVGGPEDLKSTRAWADPSSFNTRALYAAIGGVSEVGVSVPEVQAQLLAGAIDVVPSSCLAAEQLGWADGLDHLSDMVVGVQIGAIVLTREAVTGLPSDLRSILLDTGKHASSALQAKIRAEDDAAYARMKAKAAVHSPSRAERDRWATVFKAARAQLASATFPSALVSKLESFA